MVLQPGDTAELHRVGHLVQRHPGDELTLVGSEAPHRVGEVGQHEEQPRRAALRSFPEQHELVLTQHPLGQVADQQADLAGARHPEPQLGRRLDRTQALGQPLEHRFDHGPGGGEVRRHPLPAAHPLRSRQRARGIQAGIGDNAALGVLSDRQQVDLGQARAALAGHPGGDPLGHDPVDHGRRHTASSSARVAGVRAATTGEWGTRSSGAASGSSNRGKLTSPPASRTISWAAAASTAQPVGTLDQLVERVTQPTWVGRLDAHHLDPPVGRAALAQLRLQGRAVQERALAAGRPPLLARSEVMNEAEVHVGHGGSRRHGDRERVVGQPALGVQRPVDRVDHNQHASVAEVDRAALLRDGAEAVAPLVQALELVEDQRLRGVVDLERVVPATAPGARLDGPLRCRRALGEHRADGRGGTAAGGQPIRACHRAGGVHVQPMLSDHVPELASTVHDPATLVSHSGSPLLILGGAGSGKTRLILDRFLWLVGQGSLPERMVLLLPSAARADAARAALETELLDGYSELVVVTAAQLAAAVLRRSASRHDLLQATLGPGARLAMLAERIDELPLQHHDIGGNAGGLLGGFIRRIDRLKAELIDAGEFTAWAERQASPRELEFAAIFQAHDRMMRELGACDEGDLVRLAIRLHEDHPSARQPFQHVLVDDAQELDLGPARLARTLAAGALTAAGDPLAAVWRFRGAGAARLRWFETPTTRVARLLTSYRCATGIQDAAHAAAGLPNNG
jgi:hypothetical protein